MSLVTRQASHRAVPVNFGSDADREKFWAECDAALKTQTTRFAVAPRCQVMTASGRLFEAGQAISHADLHGDKVGAWVVLERHVRAGRVLEKDNVPDRSPTTPEGSAA